MSARASNSSPAGYQFGALRIAVRCDEPASGRWLHEFLTPWFAPAPPGARAQAVRLMCSAADFAGLERRAAQAALEPHACFALDREIVELPGWTEAGALTIADRERGCFYRVRGREVEIVAPPRERRVRVGLLRVVRELAAARMLARRSVLDLHAAAVAVGERAVLFVGPKQSGKTTLLVDALASGRARLLANDRVFVDARERAPRAFGMPTLVSLRTGTLRWFPDLAHGLPDRPALLGAAELAAGEGGAPAADARLHLSLSPGQLAQRLGAGVAAAAPIAAIVFPEIAPGAASWSLDAIAHEDGAARLQECVYGRSSGARAATIFAALAVGAGRGDPPRAALAERLASRIPLFRLRLGRHAYRDGAGLWLRALPLEPARKQRVA